MKKINTILMAPVLLIATFATACQADELDWDKIDSLIETVHRFEYGADSASLAELEKLAFTVSDDDRSQLEEKLIAALGDSTTAGKQFLCSLLRTVGSDKCVNALSDLLSDPETADAAIYALGRLNSESVGQRWIDATSNADGRTKAALLNALANRKDENALELFRTNLDSDDVGVSEASIRGLGNVGLVDDVSLLKEAQNSADAEMKSLIANALLNCAERFSQGNEFESEAADSIYESAIESDDLHMKIAGLRGILGHSEAMIQVALDDPVLRRTAISLIPSLSSDEVTGWATDRLANLDEEDKVLMFKALATRGDKTAAESITAFFAAESEDVRVAAIRAMKDLGSADVVSPLAEFAIQGSDAEKAAARFALTTMTGENVDQAISQLLESDSAETMLECISIVTARNAPEAKGQLFRLAKHDNQEIRTASIEAIGTMLQADDLEFLIHLLIRPREADDRATIEASLGRVINRVDDSRLSAASINENWHVASDPAKPYMLRLLGETGHTSALKKILDEYDAGSPSMKTAAVVALTRWPTDLTYTDLVEIVLTSRNAEHREIALGGAIDKVLTMKESEPLFINLLGRLENNADLKPVLEALGQSNAQSNEAIETAMEFLNNDTLRAAAGLATLRIANRLRNEDQAAARKALETVIASAKNDDVKARAQEVLFDLDKYEDHILDWVTLGPYTEKDKQGQAIYETAFEPETNSQVAGWEPLDQGISEWSINLEQQFGGGDFCAAYVRTNVWSDTKQDAQLELGSDDGVKAWVNGKEVFSQWATGGVSPRQKRAQITLNEGWNVLMLKVVDHQGGWGFCCRIRKPDGSKLEGLRYQGRVQRRPR